MLEPAADTVFRSLADFFAELLARENSDMLIASIVAGWIVFVVVVGVRATKGAEEPLLKECFNCNKESCAGCPFLEQARAELDADLQIEDHRLAA